jgi:hypothetical protein
MLHNGELSMTERYWACRVAHTYAIGRAGHGLCWAGLRRSLGTRNQCFLSALCHGVADFGIHSDADL